MPAEKEVALSIVIPCFNQGEFLGDAISSVERCGDRPYEIVIVDDGSTDPGTRQAVNDLKGANRVVIEQENLGLAMARNNGIKAARGRYILTLDADNTIRPDYIRKGIAILDRFPQVGVVYGDAEYFGEKTGTWRVPDFELAPLFVSNYIDACAVFRKSVWKECGGYDGNMPLQGYEDWDFWLSVAERGWRFHHVREVLFDYRVRSDSMLSTASSPENHVLLSHYLIRKHHGLLQRELRRLIELERSPVQCLRRSIKLFLGVRRL